ncbi:protein broad-minded-like isoform X2 [Mytilus californianus]|uniref:protein broad-minded-like isoform X2 n=1 Tax=Mytilus californianus TaxID=6549 RepID=UPI002247E8D1|nr:protein broad-minded-like isoform X2 [Mytilus californianus]
MSWKGLEGEDLVQNLRQLVISFEPQIREAGTVDQSEEALYHLEENDEHFHRHEFVKVLRRKLEDIIGPLAEEEIERFESSIHDSNGQETLINKITDKILHSRHYNDLSKKLRVNVQGAVDELIRNFDAEFGGNSHHETSDHQIRRSYMSDEDDESCGSSFGQGMFFNNHEIMQQVAEKMSRHRDNVVRVEALQTLNQNLPADFISSDHWPTMKRHLIDALDESNVQIMHLSTKFITRAFTNTSPQTREVYTLLVEYLISQFNTKKGNTIPNIKSGLDFTNPENVKLMKAFRLLNEFQQETINYWIRYPDRYLEEIIESTLTLYAINQNGSQGGASVQLSPVHFIALIDPKAQWFIKWMHGNYSRQCLLRMLEKYRPIVTNAIRHCLEFSLHRKHSADLTDRSEARAIENRRSYYTEAELEYAFFVHSAFMLGRMMCFVNGRRFFPIKLKEADETVTVTKLLVSMVVLLVDPSPSKHLSVVYEPGNLVTEIVKGICNSEQVCEICMYKDEIITALLAPVSHYLEPKKHNYAPSENTMLHVADLFAMVASSTRGRRHLMYGERKDMFTKPNVSSAAHVIARFTKRALLDKLPKQSGPKPSQAVIGAFLYICRQLYNTCEGLLVLYQYELHKVVAEAWREAYSEAERTDTPTLSDDSSDSTATTTKAYDINAWEDTLRDNLLNFASTAKGILLLQQTKAMNECMTYMYDRYKNKLQVSKCEKFGYGFMVTQVAGTAPGMVALQKTGYIKALLSELWSVLESSPLDTVLFTPKAWPVDPIERSSHKSLIKLLNVLSSFYAVYELLGDKSLPKKESYGFREIPDSVVEFVDRFVIVDSPAKIHSLFNFEQSHVFGLRVLSVMISCLDTYLLLQSQYKFQDILLTSQAENHTKDREEIIIDMLSIERNYVLVRAFLIGGPSERILPPRGLDMDTRGHVYPYPLISSYPVPRAYIPNLGARSTVKQENDLVKFLSLKKHDQGKSWLDKCRVNLIKILLNRADLVKGNVIQQLLDVATPIMSKIQEESIFPSVDYTVIHRGKIYRSSKVLWSENSLKSFQLTPLQQLGIKIAIRYGIHLKVIHTSSDVTEKLTLLLKQCAFYLQQQQRPEQRGGHAKIKFISNRYPGFDWFAATVFLIFNGNVEKSWHFLHKFSCLGSSGYLWPHRLHCSVHLPSAVMISGIAPLFSSTGHNIELLLQIELPLVASAFKMSGYTAAQICMHWLKQCFWNYLDWLDICHYICISIIMGVDYQVYLCIAILRHLQKEIMEHLQTQDLIIFLKETAIHGFHVADNIKYMQSLEKRYRKIVLPDMMHVSTP